MRSIALRGLWARKLRTFLTAFAIVLGIATVSGTFVLTDSITHAFDTIFSNIYRGTDASITGKSAVSLDATTDLPPFDESLLPKVKALPEVQAAIGGVADTANLIGSNGKVISFGGAPHLGFSVDPTQARFNSLSLVDGAWPGANQVVIDQSTAGKKDIKVGDRIQVEAQGSAQPFTVSGLVKFGTSGLDIGGATLAGFDLKSAQRLFNKEGKLDQIRVSKKSGRQRGRRCSPRSGRSSRRRRRCGAERPRPRRTRATRTPSPASCRRSCSRSGSSRSSSARS